MTTENVDTLEFNPISAESRNGGYVALGTLGGKCVVLSNLSKNVVKLSPSDMKEMDLKTVCGADWCDDNYTYFHPKQEVMVFDLRRLATDIIRECQVKGVYVESYERKSGVWLMPDGGLAVNSRKLWRPDGTVLEHGIHAERIYSASGDIGFDLDTPAANDDEVQCVLNAFGGINWRNKLGAEMLLGWFGVAIASVALRRRPHMLLTGAAGVGKSTALEMMKWLSGKLAYASTGPQTMAAFYQALAGTSRAVILDEFEADPSRRHSRDTLEIARMSYSLQEGDEGIVRGTPGGTARSYTFYSPFLAACINPAKFEPADVTRWVVLEAISRKPDAVALKEAEARVIGPRLARRFINRWANFQKNEAIVRKHIIDAGGDGRMADTVGVLLASYWTFVSALPATDSEAAKLVELLDIQDRIALHAITDEQRCLEAMMSKVLPFKFMDGIALVTRNLSIAEAIQRICDDPTGNLEITMRLAQLGMRVGCVQGTWRMFVANSPEHQELRKVFGGTKWASGGWSTVLRRLPGGTEGTQRIGAGFGAAKVTIFNMPADLLPANDGSALLAA